MPFSNNWSTLLPFKELIPASVVPFLDAMTAGYIIYFEQDYIIDPTETDFTITPANKMEADTGYHYSYQLTDSYKKTAGDKAGKFINKWLLWEN